MIKLTTRISDHGDAGLQRPQKGASRDGRRRSSIGFGEALATLLTVKS